MVKANTARNIFEALGRELIRFRHEQQSIEEFARFRKLTAVGLRVIADCLDDEVGTKIQGFLKDGTFSASHKPSADYDFAKVRVEFNPYPGSVFEIPQDIRGLLEKVIKVENRMHTQKAVLNSLTDSALAEYEHKTDRDMPYI